MCQTQRFIFRVFMGALFVFSWFAIFIVENHIKIVFFLSGLALETLGFEVFSQKKQFTIVKTVSNSTPLFSCFYGCTFRVFMVRNFHCKNRIKIVVFSFSTLAGRTLIRLNCRFLTSLRLGASWALLGCLLGAPGCLLGVSWVLLGASWVAPGRFLAASLMLLGSVWVRPGCSWPRSRLLGHPPRDMAQIRPDH